jgi:hypothetical protein
MPDRQSRPIFDPLGIQYVSESDLERVCTVDHGEGEDTGVVTYMAGFGCGCIVVFASDKIPRRCPRHWKGGPQGA